MGKKFAPSYANIYMAEFELTALLKCPLLPQVYCRFLDDIFGVWPHSLEHFLEFIHILNTHHPTIKVKYTQHAQHIDFLDTTVFFPHTDAPHAFLHTKVFFKPTDTHALLHKTSYHPKHTFAGIIKSQIIRFYRLCTEETDMQGAIRTLFRVLRGRGYTKRFLRSIKSSTLAELGPMAPVGDPPPSSSLSPDSVGVLDPTASPCPDNNPPSLCMSHHNHPSPTTSHHNHSTLTALHRNQPSPTKPHHNHSPSTAPPHNQLTLTTPRRSSLVVPHLHRPEASTVDPHAPPNPNQLPSSTSHLNRPPSPTTGVDTVSTPYNGSVEVGLPLGVPGSLSQVIFPNRFPEGDSDIRSGADQGQHSKQHIIPLVTTFTRNIIHIHSKLKHAFTHTQQNNHTLQQHKIISAYRKNRNLQDLLVRARFSTGVGSPPSPHLSHFRRLTAILNRHAFTSSPILQNITIHNTNIIYAITCSDCHIIYIGETKHTLLTRLKQHLYNIHKGTHNTQLIQHFQIHPVTSLYITGLEMKAGWSDRQRKAAEHRWIKKLKTIHPFGLNIRE